ncbi:DUF262 domain-containing protein [Catellatospora bangladeshensis]|uniref:DUF262 domain-containing protein n=2 Tax=Catellatospora bangladeshensis TaxID=310355 RepID=A0A8J3JZE0_9ACTN|nr:hypothetical protein Cba03nite_78880 [Catellatospora bangladeshensis]
MDYRLEAHEMPLHRVFSADFKFSIPEYQRPYAWDKEQAEQLLDDLAEALDRDTEEPYFLGSIVLVKQPNRPPAEVIDGQQRITTLSLLLAVLRDLTDNDELRASLQRMLIQPGEIALGHKPEPRLQLRKRDQDFFTKYVQAAGATEVLRQLPSLALSTGAQTAVQANVRALHKKLVEPEWTEDRRLALVRMLNLRTYLVVVSTPDLNSAHRIFSVMNSRGLDLSPADIFKSKVIGSITDPLSQDYAAKWEDAEESLGRDAFADLFLHLRMIFSRRRAVRGLLTEFQEDVLKGYLPSQGTQFIDDVLVPYADAYINIRDRSYTAPSGAAAVNAWFNRLAQLDNNDWRPPALWALHKHRHDAAMLDELLRALERLAASMHIRRVYTTPRVQRYAALLRELDEGYGVGAPALQLTDTERTETIDHLDGELYLANKIRKYVLLRLDEVLANSSGVTYEHAIVTVEHVLPQNPDRGSTWKTIFTDAQRRDWTHRLGNLVLLNRAKNSQAQNYEFAQKKQIYFLGKGVSTFALTSQVLSEPDWNPVVVQRRHQRLLAELCNEWGL